MRQESLTVTKFSVRARLRSFTSAGTILLSTLGNFSVSGASGADEDLFEFSPGQLGSTTSGSFAVWLDLSSTGIAASADVTGVALVE